MFDRIKLAAQVSLFLSTKFSWSDIPRFKKEVLAQTPEFQEAIAEKLIAQKKAKNYHAAFEWFPWGTARVPDDLFLKYWEALIESNRITEHEVLYIKPRMDSLPEAKVNQMIDEAIACVVATPHALRDPRVLTTLHQLHGEGKRTVVEPWQTQVFECKEIAELVDHALNYRGSAPGQKWLKTGAALAEKTDKGLYLAAIDRMLDSMSAMKTTVSSVLSEQVRGLLVVISFWPSPESALRLGRALRVTGEKIPGLGAKCGKGFSGAVWALENMGTFEALAAMSLAKARVKTAQMASQLDGALSAAARAQNITLEELEERIVPDYGLNQDGVGHTDLGEGYAELRLDDMARAEIVWFSGAKQVSAPTKAMKDEFAEEVGTLKRQKKELESAVSAQKRRLDKQMLSRRRIPYAQWKENYLDHPVVARLSRRLIWDFMTGHDSARGIPTSTEILDADGKPIAVDPATTTVKLWHPIDAEEAESMAWRNALFAREISQPFKQAFREIYILTPAEERTKTYSNRFAAQIIRQHQAVTLMKDRGWVASLKGYFDGGYDGAAARVLPEWGMTAEFFTELAGDDMTDAGIGLYLSTDQVRFSNPDGQLELLDVPAIVFSEICRDVDLFVGVASIGNDPEWQDQGQRQDLSMAAWQQASFGDLSRLAETRKDVLTRLLPRLKIGPVSEIQGKFLVVRGKRHTYKIHMGSGNILISPQDRYLCIVPSGKETVSSVFLPFEGDRTLAIILSKAFMLAEDDKIKDATILRQL